MAKDDSNASDHGAEKSIDSRYDPLFQRGFAGGAPTPAPPTDRRRERTQVRRPQPDREALTVNDAQAIRPHPTRPGTVRPDGIRPETAEFDVEPSAADIVVDDDGIQRMTPPARLNPYIVALWVIGLGLLVGGVLVQWWALMSQVNSAFSSQDGVPLRVVLISLANTVSGPMITVGIATIVGVIFVMATKDRRASGSRVDAP